MTQQFTFSESLARIHLQALSAIGDMSASQCLSPPSALAPDGKAHKFSLLLFDTGAGGLFYRLNPSELSAAGPVQGVPAAELLSRYASGSPHDIALAMATMNAIAAEIFTRADFEAPEPAKATSLGDGKTGLVGFFPPLVRRAREAGEPLLVIEMNPAFQSEADGLIEVTDKPQRLAECERIFCTAATLLNHSLPRLVEHKREASVPFELIGPTGGCLPGEIFRLGVSAVGGTRILDAPALGQRLECDAPWSDLTQKIRISADTYPGDAELIRLAAERFGA